MTDPIPQDRRDEPAVNPVSYVVLALAALILGVEAVLTFAGSGLIGPPEAVGWRLEAIQRFAFFGELLDWMVTNRALPADGVMRFFTYPFVHVGFTHAAIATVILLAVGKMVGDVYPAPATLALFFIPAFVGAAVYGLALEDKRPLLGAFPGVYGLIGGYTWLAWIKLAVDGDKPHKAFFLVAFLLGVQLLFGLLFGGSLDWVADLSGFVAGFGLAILFTPGVVRRLVQRIRGIG